MPEMQFAVPAPWRGCVLAGEDVRAVRADSREEGMSIENLLLFLLGVTAESVRYQFITVPRITDWRPQFSIALDGRF